MAEVIKQSKRVVKVTYELCFEWNDLSDGMAGGFGFDCDEQGNVFMDQLNPDALANYKACISGKYDVRSMGVQRYVNRYTEPAVLRCDCGHHVALGHHFTNTCDNCHADYNSQGTRLAPRSQWGEETGEYGW